MCKGGVLQVFHLGTGKKIAVCLWDRTTTHSEDVHTTVKVSILKPLFAGRLTSHSNGQEKKVSALVVYLGLWQRGKLFYFGTAGLIL